jgi:hypothetical protein
MSAMVHKLSIPKFAALVFVLCLPAIVRAAENPDDPAKLLEALQSDDFDVRSEAQEKLANLGESARDVLQKAAASADPDIKSAALELLGKLNKSSLLLIGLTRDGKPAAGAQGELQIYGNMVNDTKSVELDAEGRARIPCELTGQTHFNLSWTKWMPADFGTQNTSSTSFNARPGLNPWLIKLTKGGTVAAKVIDAKGNPLKDATLNLYSQYTASGDLLEHELQLLDQYVSQRPTAASDGDGKINIENVADGVYQAILTHADQLPKIAGYIRVREGGASVLPATAMQVKAVGKLEIVVKGRDGALLKKSQISYELLPIFDGPDGAELLRRYRLLRQNANQQEALTAETDDNGKLSVENLHPGKYQLRLLQASSGWQAAAPSVELKSGETTALAEYQFKPTGKLRGRILNSNNRPYGYATVCAIPDEIFADVGSTYYTLQNYVFGRSQQQAGPDGSYVIENLPAGKYAIGIYTNNGKMAVLSGVSVTADQENTAQDAIIPASADAGVEAAAVKGIVTLPDGTPAVNCQMTLYSNRSSTTSNTDGAGAFDLQGFQQGWSFSHIIINIPKYKPLIKKLDPADPTLGNLQLRLEPQGYSILKVKVVDEAGVPICGAAVSPKPRKQAGRRIYSHQNNTYKPVFTDAAGEARLQGIASGERSLDVSHELYYLAEKSTLSLLSDQDKEVVIKMKKGASITGRLDLPPGHSGSNVLIHVNRGNNTKSVLGNADGSFCIGGISPGKIDVSASTAALVPIQKSIELTVAADTRELPPMTIKMVPAHAIVVNLGKESAGMSVTAMAPRSSDEEIRDWSMVWSSGESTVVDGEGRAEIWGLPPGNFDLQVTPRMDFTAGWWGAVKDIVTPQLFQDIPAVALKSCNDLSAVTGPALKVNKASALVKGVLKDVAIAGGGKREYNYILFRLTGAAARGDVMLNNERSDESSQRVIMLNPDASIKPQREDPCAFSFKQVPAGTYKLRAYVSPRNAYNQYDQEESEQSVQQPVPQVLLKEFTIKDGETLDLGSIDLTVPKLPNLPETTELMDEIAVDPVDVPLGFQP